MERRGHVRISFRGRLAVASNARRVVGALGDRVATTDALGNTTCRAFDPLGNVAAEWGAVYPVRRTYDTQGRRTSLATTRDGTVWDTTTWAYDPHTGSCVSKAYADGSTVRYTYTPDNLPLRTTYASGRWQENVYDARRQVVAVEHSDGEIVSFDPDAFLNEIAFSNDVASTHLDRDAKGNCTNDTAVVGDESKATRRTFDEFSRLTGIDGTIYDYNADGLLASISNAIAVVDYAYTPDHLDSGYSLTLSNGVSFTLCLARDGYRRSLVADISAVANGAGVGNMTYTYDALNRPTARNADTFGYNARGEVTAANVSGVPAAYGYDEIGNSTSWTANCLNQYTQFTYDLDGNMTQCGDWTYTYDAANRLKAVSSNGVLLVTNFYDAKSRRVKKVTSDATTTFFYDGWNLVEERIAYTNGATSTIRYYWGKDVSGTLQGAGGVGGLLYLAIDDAPFVPCYDANGNVTRYLNASGRTVAEYVYDAFGDTISASGPLADAFRFRFSTKYLDTETGLYYYGYRFYSPALMRWLNRDPIKERGGLNLYGFCENNAVAKYDRLGLDVTLTTGNRNASWWQIGNRFFHQEICVDTWAWNKRSCCWNRTGRSCFSFAATGFGFNGIGGDWLGMESVKGPGILRGEVYPTEDQGMENTETLETTPCQDKAFLDYLMSLDGRSDTYSIGRHSCRTFSQAMLEKARQRNGVGDGGCKNDKKCR